MSAANIIFLTAQKDGDLPSELIAWTASLLSRVPSFERDVYNLHALPLMRSIISNIGADGLVAAENIGRIGFALVEAIDYGVNSIKESAEVLPVCLDLLCKIRTCLENGQVASDVAAIKAWGNAFKPLLMSDEPRYNGPCQEFWHVCHDKFGSNCFPEDQVDIIKESLGFTDQTEEDEAKVDISFDLMAPAVIP